MVTVSVSTVDWSALFWGPWYSISSLFVSTGKFTVLSHSMCDHSYTTSSAKYSGLSVKSQRNKHVHFVVIEFKTFSYIL